MKITSKKLSIYSKFLQVNIRKRRSTYTVQINSMTRLPLRLIHRTSVDPGLCILSFDYMCPDYLDYIGVVIGEQNTFIRNVDATCGWKSVSIDLSDRMKGLNHFLSRKNQQSIQLCIIPFPIAQATTVRLRNIRLRSRSTEEEQIARKKQKYADRPQNDILDPADYLYATHFPCELLSISTDADHIHITGNTTAMEFPCFLCEIPMFNDFSSESFLPVQSINGTVRPFRVMVDRIAEINGKPYDRIYSRWVLAVKTQDRFFICSHPRYSEHVQLGFSFLKPAPKNKKGLGDFTCNQFVTDLDDLGISFLTLNIRLNTFLRSHPEPNTIPFEYNGITYYADRKQIERYDHVTREAAKRKIVVSAIILVYPRSMSTDKTIGMLLEHPQYQQIGAYTMPNMTNWESFNLYAAAIDFLAARYNRPDGRWGRIHRWIVHNEADAGGVWTNMGNPTVYQFMDAYVKSMRLIYYTVHQYDRRPEVFISLTHYWNRVCEMPGCFLPLKLLELLNVYSRIEGDFRWGIAYHPYPEVLWNPKSWQDPNAKFSTDTPLITMKNIEVLNAWCKNASTFYEGRYRRTIMLSEQNPNSPDYSRKALDEQAACLAYVWKKLATCDAIEAYIAHSWIDARFEGGLKTGLRKYPDDPDDPYGPKPAWYLYRDLDTDQENKACEFAREIIGIDDWNDIICPPSQIQTKP